MVLSRTRGRDGGCHRDVAAADAAACAEVGLVCSAVRNGHWSRETWPDGGRRDGGCHRDLAAGGTAGADFGPGPKRWPRRTRRRCTFVVPYVHALAEADGA